MNNKIKITHDLSDFHQGQQIILTLKDQYLLKGDDLNQDQQQLQNIQLRQKGQTQFKTYMRQNIHKLADVNRSHLQSKLQGNTENTILPHYDQRKYEKVGIDIDIDEDRNELVVTKGILDKIRQEKEQREQEALNLKQNVVASEYLQPEKKVIKARKIVDKEKQMRELMSFLERDGEEENGNKNGKGEKNAEIRKREKEEAEKIEGEERRKYDDRNFDKAVKKAQEKVRAVEEFQLELALLKQRNKNKNILPPPSISKPQSEQLPSPSNQPKPMNKLVQMQLDPIMAFHRGAKQSLQQVSYTSNLSLKDTKSGVASVLNVPLPSQRFLNKQKQQQQMQQIPQTFQEIPEQQLQKMKKQLEFMEQEQNVGVGLSGTLKYLREKGMLNKQEFVGRNNDQKVNYNQPGDRVVIEYRDERGKLLTQKEAYRMISQRFHGQVSGKNKLENRKKRELMEERVRSRQSTGTTMMNILQSQTEEAHMFIRKQ